MRGGSSGAPGVDAPPAHSSGAGMSANSSTSNSVSSNSSSNAAGAPGGGGGGASGAQRAAEGLPDLLLDGDRLNMLLDIICTDYVTASYASRENGKKVVHKALQKLYLSVFAPVPQLAANVRDAAFAERCRAFYDELLVDFERKRHQQLAELASSSSSSAGGAPLLSPSMPVADDAVVRDSLKPKLLVFLDDVVKERDRQWRAMSSNSNSEGRLPPSSLQRTNSIPQSTTSSMHLLGAGGPAPVSMAGGLPTFQSGEIRMEGWLRKKGQHVNLWRDRYFMIRSTPNGTHYLCYFRRKGDKEPRGWYILGPGTTVDEVRESPSKIETKPLFTFRIRHLTHASSDDVDETTAQAVDNSPMVSSSALLTPARSTASGVNLLDVPVSPDAAGSGNDHDYDPRSNLRKANSRRFRSRAAAAAAAATAATAVVLTGGLAGVGIGMGMGMSAAAAASAGAAGAIIVQNRNKGPIALAAESLETAIWWRNSIVECIAQAEEQWKRYLNWYMDKDNEFLQQSEFAYADEGSILDLAPSSATHKAPPLATAVEITSARTGASFSLAKPPLSASVSTGSASSSTRQLGQQKSHGRPRAGSFGTLPRSIAKTFRTSATFSQETSWKLYDFSSKLRVDVERSQLHSSLTMKNAPPPALRTSIKVMASPKRVFEMLMKTDSSFYGLNHVIQEARLLEDNAEDHNDVVYWKLAPTYLWPVHVESRDLCLLRYWRKEQDSSYFICFQSTTHNDAPPANKSAAVRGSMLGGGFIISPRVHAEEHFEECWVTLTIQINPKGWIDSSLARSWYYMHAYGVFVLEMVTALTAQPSAGKTPRAFPVSTASRSDTASAGAMSTTPVTPSTPSQVIVSEARHPMLAPYLTDLTLKSPLPTKFWSEPDATSFFVRGPQYFSTQAKARSAPQAFRLVGVDLLKAQTQDKIRHIGLSSFDTTGLGSAGDGQQPLLMIINFMIPGPPHYSLVLYFTPETPSELKMNSAFADLCHSLFHGSSDEYRTKRLKLIPRVVQGTWSIREGVGSTPAILGTKVNHTYYQGKQYLEVDYDIASSTVASSIVKMILGYARDLVIDLAFVIEAQSSLELPERVLGCVRLDCVDLRHAVAFTPKPSKDVRRA